MTLFSGIPQPLSNSIDIYLVRVLLPVESSWADLVCLYCDVLSIGMQSRRSSPQCRDDYYLGVGQIRH
jgi:phage gp36-like protein